MCFPQSDKAICNVSTPGGKIFLLQLGNSSEILYFVMNSRLNVESEIPEESWLE
jgi:hypothetical protein